MSADLPGERLLRKPITGMAGCCALTPTGNAAAAPPNSADELPSPHAGHGGSLQGAAADHTS